MIKEFRVMLDYKDIEIARGFDLKDVKKDAKSSFPNRKVTVHELIQLDNGVRVVKPNYASNTSMQKWYKDPDEYALQYALMRPPDRYPQSYQMMLGSAFDGYVKNYLVSKLYGSLPREYELDNIIKSQCEPQFWDTKNPYYQPQHNAFVWGKELLRQYQVSGALADLMLMMNNASALPRFEFTVTEKLVHEDYGECVILGKPDVYFENKNGAHIILDFKCNSIITQRKASPKRGYIKCSDGWRSGLQSKDNGFQHRTAIPMREHGITVNYGARFQDVDATWCDQTTAYSWLMGTPVGSTLVAGIHQLVGQKPEPGEMCRIRVAQHHYSIDSAYQFDLLKRYCVMWDSVQKGHIFMDLSKEESDAKIERLASLHSGNEKGSKDAWLSNITREKKYYG